MKGQTGLRNHSNSSSRLPEIRAQLYFRLGVDFSFFAARARAREAIQNENAQGAACRMITYPHLPPHAVQSQRRTGSSREAGGPVKAQLERRRKHRPSWSCFFAALWLASRLWGCANDLVATWCLSFLSGLASACREETAPPTTYYSSKRRST
ncbi:hypothetical protein BDY21DRAFT_73727 [Lineolata rhizophorae]|uniref:Uncharacterized protein n=1 Tax=Lineolata rhizophorae TaxID=578093 RepID=A0A6A6NV61_9PEZI|nr:hypothetical protein BDY21DRAFT_73727 [Lineolata rhizophorae]